MTRPRSRNNPAEAESRAIATMRDAYLASGKSQRELARESGVPQATISKMFGGQKSVTLSELERLCDALDLDPVRVVADARAG